MGFRVIQTSTGAVLPGTPTPRLIEAGRGEAYFVPYRSTPEEGPRGIWYLRSDREGYTSPTNRYEQVRIEEG